MNERKNSRMKESSFVIESIAEIEKENFHNPWQKTDILETTQMSYNHVIVVFINTRDGCTAVVDISEYDNECGCEIAGYLIWNEIAGETELLRIAVSDKYKGCSFAKKLMKGYVEHAGRNCSRFLLEVRQNNIRAIGLYKQFGYEQIAIRKSYYRNPVEDALIFERIQ